MEPLPIKDYREGRGRDGYPFYAWRPNLLQNSRGRLNLLRPEHAYGSMYRNKRREPYPMNIVRWQDRGRSIRWYKSKARTYPRRPVRFDRSSGR